jgi:hypothetical protein
MMSPTARFTAALAALMLVAASAAAPLRASALEPFVASYEAFNEGKLAGSATMRVVRSEAPRWRIDLDIEGNRGFLGIIGLNIDQSTVFDEVNGQYRPLSQSTVRKALLFGRKIVGTYDWNTRSARWNGDLKKDRRQPIPLEDGDMSALLINLAITRDAEPGKALRYRFVDGGRVRVHEYVVAPETENIAVGELSYQAMRVSRTNGGNDETIFWIADGVPTPVRILHRENGQDGIDLRLIEYQGVQS